jgi:hypothetical protein
MGTSRLHRTYLAATPKVILMHAFSRQEQDGVEACRAMA